MYQNKMNLYALLRRKWSWLCYWGWHAN